MESTYGGGELTWTLSPTSFDPQDGVVGKLVLNILDNQFFLSQQWKHFLTGLIVVWYVCSRRLFD